MKVKRTMTMKKMQTKVALLSVHLGQGCVDCLLSELVKLGISEFLRPDHGLS